MKKFLLFLILPFLTFAQYNDSIIIIDPPPVNSIGCTDEEACNFSVGAFIDDGSCEYYSCVEPCPDANENGICDEDEVVSFRCVNGACFDPSDGSGLYSSLVECELSCLNSVGINDLDISVKKLLKINNLLGQEIEFKTGVPMYYIYDDGSVEKRLILD